MHRPQWPWLCPVETHVKQRVSPKAEPQHLVGAMVIQRAHISVLPPVDTANALAHQLCLIYNRIFRDIRRRTSSSIGSSTVILYVPRFG